MVDKESFHHHKITIIRNIDFLVKKNKLILNIDNINNVVKEYFNIHEEDLNESAIPLELLLYEIRSLISRVS